MLTRRFFWNLWESCSRTSRELSNLRIKRRSSCWKLEISRLKQLLRHNKLTAELGEKKSLLIHITRLTSSNQISLKGDWEFNSKEKKVSMQVVWQENGLWFCRRKSSTQITVCSYLSRVEIPSSRTQILTLTIRISNTLNLWGESLEKHFSMDTCWKHTSRDHSTSTF